MDGEPRPVESEHPSGAVRRLVAAVRAQLTLSRFHAIVGIVAGLISIAVGLYSYFNYSKPVAPMVGEIVAIVQDAKTGGAIPDATVEILTLKDAVVTTLTPGSGGAARGRLKEGVYRLRVVHPRFAAETRQVQIIAGQTAEVRLKLVPPGTRPSRVEEAVGSVKKLLR